MPEFERNLNIVYGERKEIVMCHKSVLLHPIY